MAQRSNLPLFRRQIQNRRLVRSEFFVCKVSSSWYRESTGCHVESVLYALSPHLNCCWKNKSILSPQNLSVVIFDMSKWILPRLHHLVSIARPWQLRSTPIIHLKKINSNTHRGVDGLFSESVGTIMYCHKRTEGYGEPWSPDHSLMFILPVQ